MFDRLAHEGSNLSDLRTALLFVFGFYGLFRINELLDILTSDILVHEDHLEINSGAPAAEGRQAEPHTHIRKLKGTHELIFSCVSWLAVLLVGAYARRRRRRRRRRWWSRATWRPQLTRKPKRGFSFRGLSL